MFTEKEIKDQVSKICATDAFRKSKRLVSFLQYITNEHLAGRADSLKAWTIAVDVFERPATIDVDTDSIVRVYGGKLRRALKTYYLNEGSKDAIIIRVPKGGYKPDIQRARKNMSTGTGPEISTGKSLGAKPTILVYNFDCDSCDESSKFLCNGMADEIIIALTKYPGFNILGPMFQAVDVNEKDKPSYDNGDLTFVLNGNVNVISEELRISATLTNAGSNIKIWGKSYKFDIDRFSLGQIVDEFVGQMTSEIADGQGVIFRRLHQDNYSNYLYLNDVSKAVLCYNHSWLTFTGESWIKTMNSIDNALKTYPTNSLLLALKSNSYYGDVLFKLGLFDESDAEMESLANEAVALDENLQIAQYNLVVQHAYNNRKDSCVKQAAKVFAMNPYHARILAGSAIATASVGAYQVGIEYMERARKLNPHYPGWYHFIFYLINYMHGRYEEAWKEVHHIQIEGIYIHELLRAAVLGQMERNEEANAYLKKLITDHPDMVNRPYDYIRPLFVTPRHSDMIFEGLNKAGFSGFTRKPVSI